MSFFSDSSTGNEQEFSSKENLVDTYRNLRKYRSVLSFRGVKNQQWEAESGAEVDFENSDSAARKYDCSFEYDQADLSYDGMR